MEVCRHCGEARLIRRRKLCWRCYSEPGVRDLYRRRRPVKPATHPTDALPGSLEKILVLMRRAELRQELWHPDDAPLGGRPPLGKAG
jgi:hypothetical protein